MCKTNSPDKNEASKGCVRETPQIKKRKKKKKEKMKKTITKKRARDVEEKLLHKNQDSTGCVRETPHIKMKPAWDV